MKRRTFLAFFQLGTGVPQAQQWGTSNAPQCPVCHVKVPADTPAYVPIIQNVSDGTRATLVNLRDMFCTNCGNRWVTSA